MILFWEWAEGGSPTRSRKSLGVVGDLWLLMFVFMNGPLQWRQESIVAFCVWHTVRWCVTLVSTWSSRQDYWQSERWGGRSARLCRACEDRLLSQYHYFGVDFLVKWRQIIFATTTSVWWSKVANRIQQKSFQEAYTVLSMSLPATR